MVKKTFEELTRNALRETLCIWNQSVSGNEAKLLERLTECLEKEEFDPTTNTFEIEEIKLTADPLLQILEKMAQYHGRPAE